MSNLNLMHPDEPRRPAFDNNNVVEPPATEVAPASSPRRPRDAHRNQTALIVLIAGLFVLAWIVLMQDVRVGLPGLVTVAPVEARAGSPDGKSSPPGTLLPSRPTSPESPEPPPTRASQGSISP